MFDFQFEVPKHTHTQTHKKTAPDRETALVEDYLIIIQGQC